MTAEIEALPLSLAQRRFWFVQLLEPGSPAYNVAVGFRLRGGLDPGRLRRALETVVARHEALRTTFEVIAGEPVQVFHPEISVPWEEIDLSALDAAAKEREVRRLEDEEARRPFDLARGPLLRSRLARLEAADHLWFLTFHHIVFDGWSQDVLVDELGRLYRELPADGSASTVLPELPIQYADFAAWQHEELSGDRLTGLVELWRRELDGWPTVLRLPTDRPRPPRQTFRGETRETTLPLTTLRAVEALAEREGTTPFVVFLASWLAVLHRLSGQDRILVGSPTAGRTHPDAERLIGNFVNTLVLRGDLSDDPSVTALLRRVRETTVAAIAHEELMFEQLVEAVAPERHASFNPLVQVALAVDSFAMEERELAPGLTLEPRLHEIRSAKFDLTLMVKQMPHGARLILEHNSDLFAGTTAERWLGYVVRAIEAVVAPSGSERPVSELPILGEDERRQLLAEWPLPASAADAPGTPGAARWETGIPAAFAEVAGRAPEAVAVESPAGCLSYGELDRRSAALAARLTRAGAGRGTPVAVVLDRSPELIVALLAVVRAGGAYVPLDAGYPEERRRLMVEDVGARLVLTRSDLAEGAAPLGELPGTRVLLLDRPEPGSGVEAVADGEETAAAPPAVGPDDLAYVIYTSGSTGHPKGVEVRHRGVTRLALGADYTTLGPDEAMLHLASISFDAATLEVWGPLLTGGRVVLFPAETPSPAALSATLERHRVTRLFLTTALFNQLAEEPESIPPCLRHLMTGGEQASPGHYRAVLAARPDLALSNVYGPTENTTYSTHHPVPDEAAAVEPLPIGRAIAGSTCWVLDRRLRPVPTGALGELLVGGDGLASGYRRRPALSAERFVPHPHPARRGERLYKTGDLVRWRPPGRLEFLGRNDFQVKIRGFRIEPGEVEAVLAAAPGVEQALVVVRPVAGSPALVGYWVPSAAGAASEESVRDRLRQHLPPFMVPAALVELPAFPLNAQGKVDRAALPEPDRSLGVARAGYVAPRTPLEEEIAALWAEILGVEGVGIEDDFFQLGGHSLLATRVLARLGDDFGVDIPLAALLEAPTVAGLATTLGTLLLEDEG